MFGKPEEKPIPLIPDSPEPAPVPAAEKPSTFEELAKKLHLDAFTIAAVRAYHRFAVGAEMTEEKLKAAIETVLHEPHGYDIAAPKTEGK